MTELGKRVVTASLAVPLFLLIAFFLPPDYFFVVLLLVLLLAAWEWANLFEHKLLWLKIMFVAVVAMFSFMFHNNFMWLFISVSLIAFLWLWVATIAYQLNGVKSGLGSTVSMLLVGIFVLPCFVISANWLRNLGHLWPVWFLYPVVITWIADSMAYFFGRKWGRTKLIPKVSPNKSWEGVLAGMLCSIFAGSMFSFSLSLHLQQKIILIGLTAIIAMISVFGDLSISLLKRIADVKDTGNILPGHGGVLDRVDSLLSVIVVFAVGVKFFMGVL